MVKGLDFLLELLEGLSARNLPLLNLVSETILLRLLKFATLRIAAKLISLPAQEEAANFAVFISFMV